MSAPEGKTDVPREPGHFRFNPERTSDFSALQSIYVHGLAIGVVCPDHDDASNPKTLFIGANRPASLDQFVAPALSRVIRRLAPWE
jgi:hypothetical protein